MATTSIITRPKIIDANIFTLNGETVNRVIMEINGRVVQLVNHGSAMVDVDIDNVIGKQVHILQLDEYISNEIG